MKDKYLLKNKKYKSISTIGVWEEFEMLYKDMEQVIYYNFRNYFF